MSRYLKTLAGTWTFAALAVSALPALAADEPPVLQPELREEVLMVTTPGTLVSIDIETTLYKPPGEGPFPLALINHGKASGNPHFQARSRYLAAAREFVRRGYIVATPMRTGFSRSGGSYIEPQCNIASNGMLQAKNVIAVLDELVKRPDVDPKRIIIIGQSHGGLTTMALGSIGYPGVKGLINFAGGYKYDDYRCQWERALTDAYEDYAHTTKLPSLWFYGDNDSYWGAQLPKKFHARYVAAGGDATLVSYGQFEYGDAHNMFSMVEGLPIWTEPTERFLRRVGLPAEVVFPIPDTPRPAKTKFAAIDELDHVPGLSENGKQAYRKFLEQKTPRAFAITTNGAFGWANGGYDPLARALANCAARGGATCKLYAVDQDVVWAP